MIQEAYISGQLGKAIYADSGRYFVLDIDDQAEPVECRPMDVSAFLNFGAELKTLPDSELNLASLRTELAAQRRANHALTLIISGLDDELDDETRSSAIEWAERLVEDDSARRFVRARMLARPLPAGTDIQTALEIAIRTNATSVGILYQNILDYEQAITLLRETWSEATSDYFSSYEGQLEAENKLTDLGAFAEMVTAAATGNLKALNSVVVTYGQMPELNRVLGQATLVLNDLKSRLAKKLTSTSSKAKKRDQQLRGEPDDVIEDAGSVRDVLARFKNRKETPRSRIFTADEAKEKVDHQIKAISKLILQDDITRADSYLSDLINFHMEHSEREHLGMSLCSLAKVAIDARAFELANTMVDYALMLGVEDVVISTTHALMFRAMDRYDEALTVYAETMARFPNNDVAHDGYADVLKLMGRYDEALTVYAETMARFPNDEVARNGYAEVLKAMGRYDEALTVYNHTMVHFPNDEVARDGYADVLKAMGRYDEALTVYAETMARFPNSEVVRCGYAEVLKSMGDFDKALVVYDQTIMRYPNNEVAHGGYAELLKSRGEIDKALVVYEKTVARFPKNRIVRNGYASVLILLNRFDAARSLLGDTHLKTRHDWIDYHVLAMSYIKSEEIDEAIRRLTFGLENDPWPEQQSYFANALAVAKIRKREFTEVPKILPTNVVNINVLQKQTRLALVGHSQAALGKNEEAAQTLAKLDDATNPRIINLKEAIARRYMLGQQSHTTLSVIETSTLDSRIDEQEYFLAQAA